MARITRRSLQFRTSYVVAAAALVASLVASPGTPVAAKDMPPQVEPAAREHGFVLEDGRFTSFDVRGAVLTNPYDITNKGQVVGQYYDADDGEQHGFSRDKQGRITTIDFPGVDGSLNESIGANNRGEIVGGYGNYDPVAGDLHGYVRDRNGRFTTNDFPGALVSSNFKSNNRGQIVGNYSVEDRIVPIRQFRAYLYDDGRYTSIDVPGDFYTLAADINDRGQVVGAFLNRERTAGFSFLRDADGTYTRLPDPPGSLQTVALGINNKGQIVGAFAVDPPNDRPQINGFLLDDGKFTVIDFPGAKGTQIWSINDSGQMAGFYLDPNRPMPELPAAAAGSTNSVSAAVAADSPSPMTMLADMWVVRPE
jgi:YD repeat-containing protein